MSDKLKEVMNEINSRGGIVVNSSISRAIFAGILFFVALSLGIAGAVILIICSSNMKHVGTEGDGWVTITATISQIERTVEEGEEFFDVYVNYTYDGKTYENKEYYEYSSDMHEGKEIDILCDSKNPDKIKVKGGMMMPIIAMLVMGSVFILISIALFIFAIRVMIACFSGGGDN